MTKQKKSDYLSIQRCKNGWVVNTTADFSDAEAYVFDNEGEVSTFVGKWLSR